MPRCLAVCKTTMKRCFFDAGDDGRKKFCGHHSDPSSRGGRIDVPPLQIAPVVPAPAQPPTSLLKPKRKLPETIAPTPKKRKGPPAQDAPPPVGQCENHPHCVRGFRHGGVQGRCKIRPPAPSPPSVIAELPTDDAAQLAESPPVSPSSPTVTDFLTDDAEQLMAAVRASTLDAARREEEARRAEEAAQREAEAEAAAARQAEEVAVVEARAWEEAKARREAKAAAAKAALIAATHLVIACTYPGTGAALPAAAEEATAALVALGRETSQKLVNPNADRIVAALNERAHGGLHVALHGNAPLAGDPVPLLSPTTGGLQAHSIDWWVELIKPLVAKGLRYVYLGGCCTAVLGRALRDRAGVPAVVCFEGKVENGAAKIFGTAFAQAIGDGATPADASAAARKRVLDTMEEGMLDTGVLLQETEKYEFISPEDERVHECSYGTVPCTACRRVGACPWFGRLSPTTRAQRNRVGWKGRMAAGIPLLLE